MRSIRDFLSRRHVLLTGGTGFLGKALLEKILRAVPEVGRLYLLVRSSRRTDGTVMTPRERVRREVFETAIFSRLRQEHGERFWSFLDEKIEVLAGDLTQPDLGLDAAATELLREHVDIVVHGAASVFFDERIDRAVEMNSLGPRRLVELTKTFKKSAIFAFVSTAYVSGVRRGLVPEELPQPGKSAAQLAGVPGALDLDVGRELAEIEVVRRDVLKQADSAEQRAVFAAAARGRGDEGAAAVAEARETWITRALVDEGMRRARHLGWHEVYTFTKAMGEALVFQVRGDLPVALVRPSIIESSLAEPEPGWINGLKVADPLIAGYAKGRIPDFPGDRGAILDLIPVDFVANAILAAIERLDRERQTTVYHIATGARNPIRVGEVFELMRAYYRRHPMRDKRGEPIRTLDWKFPRLADFKMRYRWLYQKPLGLALGVIRATRFLPWAKTLEGRIERTLEGVGKLLYFVDIYGPYTSLLSSYQSDNTKRLFDGLTPADKRDFNFDVESISWPNYIQDIHLSGLDRHVLRFGGAQSGRRGKRGGRMSTEDLRTLPDLLRLSAERFGDKVALQVKREDAWVRVTYRELLKRAGQVGSRWRRAGLTRGARVLLISENQPEWCIAYMAVQSVGATVVPIDVHTPALEIHEIVEFVGAAAVVASPTTFALLPKSVRAGSLPIWNLNAEGAPFEDRGAPVVPLPDAHAVKWEELSPDDTASVIFTSGPAVDPRGVMLSHRNFLANLLALAEVLRSYETDRFLSVLPLHHALEFTGGLLMPLLSGATVTYAQSLKSNVILSTMRETGATALLAVPRIFEMLLDRLRRSNEGYAPGERSPEFDSFVNQVRLLVSGGAPLDFSIYEGFAELGFSIHEGYGLTETAPILTVNPLWAVRPRTVGKPLPGVELKLVERAGEDPEIVVRGPNLMSGYYNNPEATAHVLRDGWLHTGDLGRLDGDGYLTITGRSKELIVTGAGKNVWPEEVELFYRSIEGIDQIVVFGVREPGATRETVHAAVTTKIDSDRVLEGIHRVAHERPSYQRIQQVHFWAEPIPRLAGDGHRPDRRALREATLEILRTRKLAKRAARLPSHELPWWERDTLALLGRIAVRSAEEGVSARDSLTQLFDSLQMLELVTAMESRFGVTVKETEIEAMRTVADVLVRVKAEVGDRPEPPPGEYDEPLESDYWARILAGADAAQELPGVAASGTLAPLRQIVLAVSSAVMRTVFRLSVHGLERLPRGVPFVVAANHSSHLDTFAIVAALRGKVRRVHVLGAKDYFFDSAVKSWFFRNFFNVVPFDREKNFVEGFRAARQILRADEPLLIFPEGTRSPNGRLQPFKVGLGILALELGAAVVPARIRGTYEAMPKGRALPRPARVDIAIGEAVSMEPFLERRGTVNTYGLYREVVNEVRQRVDQLVEQA